MTIGLASAADIAVPSEQDPLGWARAWAEVVDALEDPELIDTRIEWAPGDGGWTLSLEHADQRARVSGLTPASTHADRLEQLYVALSLLGRSRPQPRLDSLITAPPRRPEPSPATNTPPPPGEPGPQAEPSTTLPPFGPWPSARPTTQIQLVTVPPAVDDDRGPFVATASVIPGNGLASFLAGGSVQVTWQPIRFGVALHSQVTYDRDIQPVEGVLPGGARIEELRVDVTPLAVARLWTQRSWALTVAAGAGATIRRLGRAGNDPLAPTAVPMARAQVGAEAGGRTRMRVEFAVLQDLQPLEIEFGTTGTGGRRFVRLPSTRAQFGVGCTIGGRR